eukprot:10698137-Karenia_brevis.AAC.1
MAGVADVNEVHFVCTPTRRQNAQKPAVGLHKVTTSTLAQRRKARTLERPPTVHTTTTKAHF